MAAEATIQGALKTIQTGRPESQKETLKNMSKIISRTRQILAPKWINMLPEGFREWGTVKDGNKEEKLRRQQNEHETGMKKVTQRTK